MLPLFVYGTLKSGAPRSGMLGDRPREQAWVHGSLYALRAGYPALSLEGDGRVHGQVVRDIGPQLLAVLDLYEDVHSGLYRRVEVDATAGLRVVRCQTYVMERPWERPGRLVRSGRWRPIDR